MDKLTAIKELSSNFDYSDIVLEHNVKDMTLLREIALAWGVRVPVRTYTPDIRDPKGPQPIHSKLCNKIYESRNEKDIKEWTSIVYKRINMCPCWKRSFRGVSIMALTTTISTSNGVYPKSFFGRGTAWREEIKGLFNLAEKLTIKIKV